MILTLVQTSELFELVDFLDALMPEKVANKNRRGVLCFKAQVIELQSILQASDTVMMKDGDGLTSLAIRAYLMNVMPHALARAFVTYVTMEHGYYTATFYPEVPLDWMAVSEETVCPISMINGNAFLKPDLLDTLVKAPALQFFGYVKTVKQIKQQVSRRYITRSRKTVYQQLYVDSKPENFFLCMVDNLGVYENFPLEEDEYNQVRETVADTLSYGHIVELSETVMPRVRPKKVIHFQPMFNIFSAQEVPRYLGRTPWYDRVLKDPFDNADDYSRNWIFFYRSCNPMTKYVWE